jgi:regulatory protein
VSLNVDADKPGADPRLSVRITAMGLLARREHSYHELFGKLKDRLPALDEHTVLRPVLDQLVADNLLSDARFVEAYVRYRSTRGDGPLKIAAGLQPRKIAAALVKHALYEEGPDWVELCRKALNRKFHFDGKPATAELQRIQRFLLQRGFTGEQIRLCLKASHEYI